MHLRRRRKKKKPCFIDSVEILKINRLALKAKMKEKVENFKTKISFFN